MTSREALHLQPAQAIGQIVAALGCALWLVALPLLLYAMIVRQQWASVILLPFALLQLNTFLRYTLRAERVYATEAGLEVLRAGTWCTLPWTAVTNIEALSQWMGSPIKLLRVRFDAQLAPVMFYGNAQTQVRLEALMQQAQPGHSGDAAASVPRTKQPELRDDIALHSPAATRHVVLAIRSFLALCATSTLVLLVERQWSALLAQAALTASIALFLYPALRTVNLFATRDGLLVVRRSGQRFSVEWSAVGPVETPRVAAALPTSMARLYQLRLGGEGTVAFFSDLERLRELERRRGATPDRNE